MPVAGGECLIYHQKNAWRDFGELYGFTGYNAFTKGICASYIADGFGLGVGRLGSALFGGGASNFYSRLDTNYLSKVGHLSVGNVQSSILVRQMHPLDYIMRERASKKNHVFLFNFKEESASGTFNFGCGYNVIPDPAATNFSIELCVRTYASNNDNTGSVVATISLSNVGGWQTVSGVVDLGSSVVWGYSLDFVFTNFAGDFYFDNIVAKYLGTNFAFDNSCEIIVWNRANNWPEVQDIWAIQNVVNSTILQMERYDRILLTSGT